MKTRKWVIKKRRKKSFVKEEHLKYLPEIYFEVICSLNKRVRITKNHWNFIIKEKHLEIEGHEDKVKLTLAQPETVRQSQEDEKVFLYYHCFGKHYLCVVTKHLNGDGFIITVYFTAKVKEGKLVWKK